MSRPLPDPSMVLHEAADFIADSDLARRALACTALPGFPVFLRDMIALIHRLTLSCQLPEFTDHGLAHSCSMVDRVSLWTCSPSQNGTRALHELLTSENAAVLLVAILAHDIGMLSQNPMDLAPERQQQEEKGLSDVPAWVRRTHIDRIERLLRRALLNTAHCQLLDDPLMGRAMAVARAHGTWPWQSEFIGLPGNDPSLAAVLAVSDLLDEDASRCDTVTMLHHRQGSTENMGHWIRHSLTSGRVLVSSGVVSVRMVRPPCTGKELEVAFRALRNHFRLVRLYDAALKAIGVGPLDVQFEPSHGCPPDECVELSDWQLLPGLATQDALAFHLLNSFMSMALLDERRVPQTDLDRLALLGIETVDLTFFRRIAGEREIRSPSEAAFHAILNEMPSTT